MTTVEGRPKMLIVDDDEAIRVMMTKVFEREDFEVTTAKDGQEAIEAVQRTPFSAVLLDLMMPRIDGFGVMKFLKERMPEVLPRVIVMTAYTAAAKEKIDPHCRLIPKPFDVVELVRTVRQCAGIAT